jgi:hypothetical protein
VRQHQARQSVAESARRPARRDRLPPRRNKEE